MPSIIVALALLVPSALQIGDAWQTYRNPTYGYEIRYPPECDVIPTGPERERDGRSIRVARREYAAPTPMLHIHVGPASESIPALSPQAPGLTAVTDAVDLSGRTGRRTVFRWRTNGDIFMVDARAPGVVLIFEPSPGTREVDGTVWAEIMQSFRFLQSAAP